MAKSVKIIVIGGGIAGVSCIESLIQNYDENNSKYDHIILVSANRLVKRVVNLQLSGRNLEKFDVVEEDVDNLQINLPTGLKFESITGWVIKINSEENRIIYISHDDQILSGLSYDILCLCIGASPKILNILNNDHTIVIRDTSTVEKLRDRLQKCRQLVIVGNGGISLELVTKISNCKKTWIVRNESIGQTYFDSGASKFLLDAASSTNFDEDETKNSDFLVQRCYSNQGPSLGPNWSSGIKLRGCLEDNVSNSDSLNRSIPVLNLDILYNDEVENISFPIGSEYPIEVSTRLGKRVGCDLIAAAVGVLPNSVEILGGDLNIDTSDNGIIIDNQMRTSLNQVYAAGDVVSCKNWPVNKLWFQMRLWTQARQMGQYASRCIYSHLENQDPMIYFTFDCFTHCTSFFGFKIVLLGCYNGQLREAEYKDCEVLVRVNAGKDYVKLIIQKGKIIGAVLVGDSGLEETIENLIYDQIDVSQYKEQLLDDTVDIEDYFD